MTPRTRRWTLRVFPLLFLATCWLAGGCATTQFGPAIAYYAAKTAVTDAAARHVEGYGYYRFNSLLLSDLDDAIACADVQAQRKMAADVLRGARALSQTSSSNEIERMPESARKEIAKIAGISEDADVLEHHFSNLAKATLDGDLRAVNRLTQPELRSKLTNIRESIDILPDDKKRSARKILYAWAASMTARGIEREEAKLPKKCRAKVEKTFDRVVVWWPDDYAKNSLIKRYAPIISMEWPKKRPYDVDYDKIGAVKLSSKGKQIEVQIDTKKPSIYSYTTVAKIHGRRFRQLNYVWWFSERPEMTKDDPVAGHIDGSMIRITLDDNDNPMFIESTQNCGCSHEVFVSKAIESAAYQTFGGPQDGKHFSVEKFLPDKHDIVVTETFDVKTNADHPLILSAAGYHEVNQIKFNVAESINALDIIEKKTYNTLDYEKLDRLPLKGGIASMFGPDGLVHFAGRPEGFLLAPSGILSAGQPRKRGTQRVRWDDFLHDDPHLLENTLRIPPLD